MVVASTGYPLTMQVYNDNKNNNASSYYISDLSIQSSC